MATPLLAAKLYIPSLRPKIVRRPRLVDQLNDGIHGKLTLVAAPAGFGKTTLVGEWISHCERPTAWLSLDEGDGDRARFLTYLVAALRTIQPKLGDDVLGMLQSPQTPPIRSVLTSLLNDIADIHEPFTLVLDDYHVVNIEPINEVLAFLLEHQSPRMHLVIITREDPHLSLPQ
jgi:LuxR family maltose regulon positive regulatory protein